MSGYGGYVNAACPECEDEAHEVCIQIEQGYSASRHGPSEGDSFEFTVPESCPTCGHVYSADQMNELESVIQNAAESEFGRSYNQFYTGPM